MSRRYGIKLVWAGWTGDDEVIGFSEKAYEQWKNDVGGGWRFLLYETGKTYEGLPGSKSIIGEVRVLGRFRHNPTEAPTEEHDWIVPIQTVHSRSDVSPIPLEHIRSIVKKSFPRQGQALEEITRKQYDELISYWK